MLVSKNSLKFTQNQLGEEIIQVKIDIEKV